MSYVSPTTRSDDGYPVGTNRSPTQSMGNSQSHQYGNRNDEIQSVLREDRPSMVDEGENPMASVHDDGGTGSGQMAPRNMSSWIARACDSILGKRYVTQDAASANRELASALMRNAYIQTEPPQMKDASAMIIDGNMESERLNNLDIGIPGPADLPVLTTSQLLELERRLGDLMGRLDEEIRNAEGEIKRQKEQAAELEKREAVMHSNRFGKWQSNDEWVLHMRNKIEGRLHRRHGFADVPSLPAQKENLDSTLNSPLRTKHSRTRTAAQTASLLGVGTGGGGSQYGGGGSNNNLESLNFHHSDSDVSRSQSGQPLASSDALDRSINSRSLTPTTSGQIQRKGSFVAFKDEIEQE